jgi:Holliday junction resolvase RusA-like endonuclease
VIKIKTRKQKTEIYNQKFSMIPKDYQERINWIIDTYKISDTKLKDIIDTKDKMLQQMYYMPELFVIIYEIPEGSPRPRARFIKSKGNNILANARSNPGFIQVYSITGASDKKFMQEFKTNSDFDFLESLIYTPCSVKYDAYFKTPSIFNSKEKMLAELGMIRPLSKPDFDNVEKKYSDMYTGNIWVDDSIVIESNFNKYYSELPRIEITLRYMNMLYNKYQYKSVSKRLGLDDIKFFN